MKVPSADAVGWEGTEAPSEQKSSLFCYFSLLCKLVLKFHALLDLLTVTLRRQVLVYLGKGSAEAKILTVYCADTAFCAPVPSLELCISCLIVSCQQPY